MVCPQERMIRQLLKCCGMLFLNIFFPQDKDKCQTKLGNVRSEVSQGTQVERIDKKKGKKVGYGRQGSEEFFHSSTPPSPPPPLTEYMNMLRC